MKLLTVWTNALGLTAALVLVGCGGGNGDGATDANAIATPNMKALAVATPTTSATVVALTKVSETRVSRTVFDYVFKITVQNGGTALAGVAAHLATVGQGTSIVDGDVVVGNMDAGGSATPADTITLRHDRAFTFNQAAVTWSVTGTPVIETINGIVVPPEPDPVANKATLAGIDVNGNGVRDDVERLIASKSAGASAFDNAMRIAAAYQSAMTGGLKSQADSDAYLLAVTCNGIKATSSFGTREIQIAMLNLPERIRAFRGNADKYSGKFVNPSKDCL